VTEQEAFLQAIWEEPDDDGPRLMFADWLKERGDPWGDLIEIQCELARTPTSDPMRALVLGRETALRLALYDRFVEPLRPLLGELTHHLHMRRGFVEVADLPAQALLSAGTELFKRAPLLISLRLSQTEPALARLMAYPALRRVREVDFRGVGDVSLLTQSPNLCGLHRLGLDGCQVHDAGLAALVESNALSSLRELSLRMNGLTDVGLQALASSTRVPQLACVRVGERAYAYHISESDGFTRRGLRAVVGSPNLPALHTVYWHGTVPRSDDPTPTKVEIWHPPHGREVRVIYPP
jgi:uncharacterized protein (TIGR02996 family)